MRYQTHSRFDRTDCGHRIGRSGRMTIDLLLCGLLIGLMPCTASGQSGDRDRRRQFVEGLLQTLVESQLPPTNEPTRQPQPTRPGSPAPPAYRTVPREMAEVRSELAAMVNESRQLLQTLQSDWTQRNVVGPLVGDTATMHHAASTLAARSRSANHLDPIAEDYRQLNSDWRVLAHRIRQAQGLSSACLARVNAIDRHDRQLCRLLGVQAQLDHAALHRQTIRLTVDLQNLCEDLDADLPPSSQKSRTLDLCHASQQRAAEVTEAAFGGADQGTLQAVYRNFRQAWSALADSLRPIEIPYVQRTVRRVWQSDRVMHELLWLPYQTDSSQMIYMAQVLQGRIDALYHAVSLDDLIDLPPVRRVLPTASEFYGLCEYFSMCAEGKYRPDELAKAYWDIDSAWPEFSTCFAAAKSPEVHRTLVEIEQSMSALRQMLGIPPEIDWDLAQQRSARLEYYAHTLEGNLESTLRTAGSYPSQTRNRISAATTKSQAFCEACSELSGLIVAKADQGELAQHCAQVTARWTSLQKDLNAVFREEDVRDYISQIAKSLVELQATFGP